MYERHDGRGQPGGLSDLEISTPAQVLSAAQTLEVAARAFGLDGAIDVFRTRRGGQFAPAVADAFLRDAHGVLRDLDTGSLWNVFRESEPLPRALVSMDQVDDVARAFAHFTDVKSTFTLGHSVMVAELALAAADGLGAPIDRTALERAALLHDIGRVAVENAIWDKPGPLDPMERTAAESHSFETERILRSSPLLAPLIDCIGVHERLDGRGYHRRVPASEIGMAARLLAACDVWCALVSDRPQRRAYPKAKAVATLGEEARAGRLDRDAVRAVIEATGGKLPKLTRELVAGLSEREIDVVALLARGLTNKQIGVQLRISEKTAKNHVAAIYAKTGVTTRAGAALFASQHGLVGQGRASEK
jgi:putative nucleotidyltransferase with HDIG domain